MSATTNINSSTLAALFTLNTLNEQITATTTSLATGVAIQSAANLIASTQLQATLAYLDAESSALQSTSNIAATADAALGEVSSLLIDASAIEVQLAGGGLSGEEEAALQLELDSINQSIDSIASNTTFNGQNLLDGTLTLSAVGVSITLPNVSGATLDEITTAQAELGAFQSNTIDSYESVLDESIIQISAASSLISDTDFAVASASLVQQSILQEASILVLSILNDTQSNVLDLLA